MITTVTFSQAAKKSGFKKKLFIQLLLEFGLIKISSKEDVYENKKRGREHYKSTRYEGNFIINSLATPRKTMSGSIPQQHLDERIIDEFTKRMKIYQKTSKIS
ncbi:hypothetical protein [Morganella morganii]|uniref:hypothetical protein n=1 Tax=Morganella morganii TaxID=582 RepID=UPI00076B2949|nr:hypothetical protein [Morganella morganii]AMG70702.1 hypothetical protein AL531_10295 [Morganella morganii]MBT0348748.1 hypothetical protein [Morganella morganii subsp. morganii]MBT0433064.1 hypothetical protein [Morganella morganii subsp. morganii]MDO7862047.1 hypothetical protein [Morganella morganii]